MTRVEGTDFKKSAVHLVWGEDGLSAGEAARKIVDQLCPPDQQSLGLEVIDGAGATIDEAVAAVRNCIGGLRTCGFFGAGKVVWLRDAKLLSTDEKPGMFDDVKAAVALLAEEIKAGLPDGQYLLITADRVDRRTVFFKACQAKGAVHEFNLPEKDRELGQRMREIIFELLRDVGLTMQPDAFEAFLTRTGNDTRQISQEIDKLRCYVGSRNTVTADDVRAIVTATREAAAWDLADALGKRNAAAALGVLRQLLYQRISPMALIGGLESRVRDMLILRTCIDRRWVDITGENPWYKASWRASPDADAALSGLQKNDPRSFNPFRAGILGNQARNYTMAELVRMQRDVVNAHVQLKSSSIEDPVIMELLLMKCIGRAERAA
ncbi:MAG TPA: DNA polymerase III subunit delta [Kiritimatiellia bacterium]